eukprot:gene11961-15957_t
MSWTPGRAATRPDRRAKKKAPARREQRPCDNETASGTNQKGISSSMSSKPLDWRAAAAAGLVLGMAAQSAGAVFDRGLLDDALGLAASVGQRDGRLQVDLSAEALRAVLFDQSESVHFAVRSADGALVAGQPDLRAEAAVVTSQPADDIRFADLTHGGELLRAVLLQRSQPQPYSILLAQTTRERTVHLRRMLVYAMAPLAGLLLLLGVWLGRAIARDLQPVVGLQEELNRRQGAELQPISLPASTLDLDRRVSAVN